MHTATATSCVQFLSQNRPGPQMGMGLYEQLLLKNLISNSDPEQWRFDILFSGRSRGVSLDPDRLQPGLGAASWLGFSTDRVANWPWVAARAAVGAQASRFGADLVHSLALSFPTFGNVPAVYTIHDLPPGRFNDEGQIPRWAKRAVSAAATVITPSEFAKRELVELLEMPEEKIVAIPYGCEHERFNPSIPPASREFLQSLGISGPFLFYVGGFTRRKNVSAMLQAWRKVSARRTDLSLVLAGPKEPLADLLLQTPAERVVLAGYMSRSVLPGLIRACTALVCPSIYEGFGLPPLEAMACGKPVIAVRAGAIPEVVGSAAELAADGEPESLANAMERILEDDQRAAQLGELGIERAKQFCWNKHAQEVLGVYRQALA